EDRSSANRRRISEKIRPRGVRLGHLTLRTIFDQPRFPKPPYCPRSAVAPGPVPRFREEGEVAFLSVRLAKQFSHLLALDHELLTPDSGLAPRSGRQLLLSTPAVHDEFPDRVRTAGKNPLG